MIITWILIIAINDFKGAAIEHVPGFATQAECMQAAGFAMNQFNGGYGTTRAVCVQQSKPR